MDKDTLFQRKAALGDRRDIVRGLRRKAARCKAEAPDLADSLTALARSEASAIDRALGDLARVVRREMRARFRRRFKLTTVQQRTLSRCRYGEDFRALWDRWNRLPSRPHTQREPAAKIALRRPAARPRQSRPRTRAKGAPKQAADHPEPAPFARSFFTDPDDLTPRDEPDPVLRYLRNSRAWVLVEQQVQAEIRTIVEAGRRPLDSAAVRALDRHLVEAVLATNQNPQNYGLLWLPGQVVPVLGLMTRNKWRLWRLTVDAFHPDTAAQWRCWGGRA